MSLLQVLTLISEDSYHEEMPKAHCDSLLSLSLKVFVCLGVMSNCYALVCYMKHTACTLQLLGEKHAFISFDIRNKS